jgi:hypothetical protein
MTHYEIGHLQIQSGEGGNFSVQIKEWGAPDEKVASHLERSGCLLLYPHPIRRAICRLTKTPWKESGENLSYPQELGLAMSLFRTARVIRRG